MHWLEANRNYFVPEKFRLEMNACIQALRSVTFLLQKRKVDIPDFEAWYRRWQERLRADSLMKWSVEARNRIVKEGDLKLYSVLRVSIVGSYLEHEVPYLQYLASPKLTSEKIFKDIPKLNIPPEVIKNSYLHLERRWVVNDLPNQELLSCLSYCWGFLAKLLSDVPSADAAENSFKLDGVPPCMIDDEELRSLWIKLSSGDAIEFISEPVKLNPEEGPALIERYELERLKPMSLEKSSLREIAYWYFNQAKVVLIKDGYHSLIVILILPSNSLHMMQLVPEDQADKYRLWRHVATEIKRTKARALIAISEAWTATVDPTGPYQHAAEVPDRGEALHLIAASQSGDGLVLSAPFQRLEGRVEIASEEETDLSGLNLIAPVLLAWRDMRSATSGVG